jgi:hypothetical protein
VRRRHERRNSDVPKNDAGPVKRSSVPRMSVTVQKDLRKLIRIAAARADMEESEWCRTVLVGFARRVVDNSYGEGEADRL